MFCLDTNVVIGNLVKNPSAVVERLRREFAFGTPIIVPAIVLFELQFGIANSARPDANRAILDTFLHAPIETPSFDNEDAIEAADIRAHLRRQGTPIGPYDVLIAAQARRRGATLVTGNVREFRRVPGLAVQNWAEE